MAEGSLNGKSGWASKLPDLDSFNPSSFLFYRTQKLVKVHVWQLGVVYNLTCAVFASYVLYSVFEASQWAKDETISSQVNAWISNGKSGAVKANAAYCSNASYDYDYGGGWVYPMPHCVSHTANEISVKEPSRVFVTTMYQQSTSIGWDCGPGVSAPVGVDTTCAGGTLGDDGNGQCTCDIQQTVFPLGVEEMTVSFRHTYTTRQLGLAGDSSLATPNADGVLPLDTRFIGVGATGATIVHEGGATLTFPIKEFLAMANVTLDSPNTGEPTDARASSTPAYANRKPFMRTTGVQVDAVLSYSNKNPDTGKPDITINTVRADTSLAAQKGWAGLGALPTIYAVYPSGKRFHTINRYRQGVLINFDQYGSFYRFDFIQVVMALVTGAVLIAGATTVTDLVAINLYRIRRGGRLGFYLDLTATSNVLRAKRIENVSPESTMAAQGMYGALAVASFKMLDSDGDGQVDGNDIVRAFAQVDDISYKQAKEIAKLIMEKGDRSGGNKDGVLSFSEFVSVLSQDMMPFGQLLSYMDIRADLGHGGKQVKAIEVSEGEFDELRAKSTPATLEDTKPLPPPMLKPPPLSMNSTDDHMMTVTV